MPNFNGANYIKESIESVLDQSYPEFELIIVDDGSTDNSLDIATQFHDNRISVVCRSDDWPKGANACRNIGIEKSRGDYLLFLDSDDLLMPDCLKNRVLFMNSNKTINFSVFNSVKFFEDKNITQVFTRLNVVDPISHFICTDNLWQTSSVIWKSEFVRKIGGYNLNYQRLQDPEMTVRALIASHGNFKLFKESTADTYYRRPPKLGDAKLLKSYKAMSQFIKDFYISSNADYINNNNAMFIFLIFTSWHLKYCSYKQDIDDYILRARTLSEYNSLILNSWIYKLSKYQIKMPYIFRRILSYIAGRKALEYKKKLSQ
jgi:glycosyltransferase involved in cell wall biosynthesis